MVLLALLLLKACAAASANLYCASAAADLTCTACVTNAKIATMAASKLTGTVAQSAGGTGAAALTCTSGQALSSNGTAYACTSTLTASDVACASTCVSDAEISAVAGSKVSGAVATATALAATPAACAANRYAISIAASGDLTCAQVTTAQLSGTVTNAQLASSYSGVGACASNQWASTLNANATPTCTQPAFSNISGTATNAQLASSYSGVGACGANTFASTLNTNAAPTCTQPAFSNLTGTATVTQGGTGAAPGADDQVFVSSSTSAGAWQSIPNCTDTTGNHLNYTTSTNAFSCGTSKPTIDLTLFDVSTGLGAGTLLATGTVYGGMKLINAATVSHMSLYVSVASATTVANQVLTITDGTNTCTATFACNTVTNTTGVKDVATANGSGTGCVYAANALLTFSTTTQGCATAATVKNINVVGHY